METRLLELLSTIYVSCIYHIYTEERYKITWPMGEEKDLKYPKVSAFEERIDVFETWSETSEWSEGVDFHHRCHLPRSATRARPHSGSTRSVAGVTCLGSSWFWLIPSWFVWFQCSSECVVPCALLQCSTQCNEHMREMKTGWCMACTGLNCFKRTPPWYEDVTIPRLFSTNFLNEKIQWNCSQMRPLRVIQRERERANKWPRCFEWNQSCFELRPFKQVELFCWTRRASQNLGGRYRYWAIGRPLMHLEQSTSTRFLLPPRDGHWGSCCHCT